VPVPWTESLPVLPYWAWLTGHQHRGHVDYLSWSWRGAQRWSSVEFQRKPDKAELNKGVAGAAPSYSERNREIGGVVRSKGEDLRRSIALHLKQMRGLAGGELNGTGHSKASTEVYVERAGRQPCECSTQPPGINGQLGGCAGSCREDPFGAADMASIATSPVLRPGKPCKLVR
jgi:hypothetical protein